MTSNSSTSKTHSQLNRVSLNAGCVLASHFRVSWVHSRSAPGFQTHWRVCTRAPCPTVGRWNTAISSHCCWLPTGVPFLSTPLFCPFDLANGTLLKCSTTHWINHAQKIHLNVADTIVYFLPTSFCGISLQPGGSRTDRSVDCHDLTLRFGVIFSKFQLSL